MKHQHLSLPSEPFYRKRSPYRELVSSPSPVDFAYSPASSPATDVKRRPRKVMLATPPSKREAPILLKSKRSGYSKESNSPSPYKNVNTGSAHGFEIKPTTFFCICPSAPRESIAGDRYTVEARQYELSRSPIDEFGSMMSFMSKELVV